MIDEAGSQLVETTHTPSQDTHNIYTLTNALCSLLEYW